MVDELKRKYKHVYAIDINGDWYVVRPLTWKEHRDLVELGQNDIESPDKIIELALLYPGSIDDILAGVVDSLANAIIDLSGFGTMEAFEQGMSWAREEVKKLEQQVIMTICSAFRYRPEDLYQFTFLDLMLRFAMAESILGLAPPEERPPPQARVRKPFPEYRDSARRMDGPPVSQGMEAYGDLSAPPPPPPDIEAAMRGKAAPPDFTRDNAELLGNG